MEVQMDPCVMVMVASLVLSALLAVWFFAGWRMEKRVGGTGDYLLWYGIYLVTVNMPILVLTIVNNWTGDVAPLHGVVTFFFDLLNIAILLVIASCWCPERKAPWWLFGVGFAMAAWHQVAQVRIASIGEALVLFSVLGYTVYCISKDSPRWVVLGIVLSYAGWAAVNFAYPHAGDPVGHAWGMVVKVAVFGAVAMAHYERQHRHMYLAAYMRKTAIDIYTGTVKDIGQVEENDLFGRGTAHFSGPSAAHRTNG